MSDEIDNGNPQPMRLSRRLIGYPVMGIGFFVMANPFIGIWNLHDAIALFGGGFVLIAGSICALGWEVVRKTQPPTFPDLPGD